MKYLLILISLKIIAADLSIDITAGTKTSDVSIDCSGNDVKVISEDEIKLFDIGQDSLKEALKASLSGRSPDDVFLKSPTPWGDMYKLYHWNQVSRVLSIESASVKRLTKKPIMVTSQDFANWLSNPIKVTAVLSQAVQSTLVTTWTSNEDVHGPQGMEHGINIIFTRLSGSSSFAYTSSWGESVVKSETVVIGSTSAVEMEVQPLKSVTAVLTATKGCLEVEVTYVAKLRGHVAVRLVKPYDGLHFRALAINEVLEKSGRPHEIRSTQLLKFEFYSNVTLDVFSKASGKAKSKSAKLPAATPMSKNE